MDRKHEVLTKAEKILTKYKDYDSVYYKELQKSYKEFKNLDLLDKYTIDLYCDHIDGLCDMINQSKNALPMTLCIFFIFIVITVITSFSAYHYFDKGINLKNNIIKANSQTTVKVEYQNLENFNAMSLIADSEYIKLNPLKAKLTIDSTNKKNSYLVHYDIYLVPDNGDLSKDEIIDRNIFMYNIKTNTKDSDIQTLNNREEKKGRILLFSNEAKTNSVENIELRMWLNSRVDESNKNKKYKFKLYIDSYVI